MPENLDAPLVDRQPLEGAYVLLTFRHPAVARQARPVPYEAARGLRIDVIDTGVGISAQDQELIWQEFRQLNPDGTPRTEGTGLGLPLTRRLVEVLGGVLWLESEPGVGSRFSLVLPVQVV